MILPYDLNLAAPFLTAPPPPLNKPNQKTKRKKRQNSLHHLIIFIPS